MSNAVFTLLYDPSYLPGALVLGLSLRRLLQKTPANITLGVLIDLDVFSDSQVRELSSIYDELVDVKPVESTLAHKLVRELKRPELNKTFTKIELWNLDYQKVLYLDCDTLATDESRGSVLDLFDLEFAANKLLAAPDSGFPDIFNSGVMLLSPNQSDYHALSDLVHQTAHNQNISFDGADQGLLNQYFNHSPDWVQQTVKDGNVSNNWIPLPFLYNVTPTAQYQYLPAFNHFTKDSVSQSTTATSQAYAQTAWTHVGRSQIKLVHFIGPVKPWNSTSEAHHEWWSVWTKHYGNRSIADVTSEKSAAKSIFSAPDRERQLELLDPANYQQFETVAPSKDSSWNPATEAPPKGESQPSGINVVNLVNVWDAESSQVDGSREASAEPHQNPPPLETASREVVPPKEPLHDATGSHLYEYVAPERVFDDSDYFPQHKIQPTIETSPSNTTQCVLNEVADKLNDLVVADTTAPESTAPAARHDPLKSPSPRDDTQNIQRLFPWEFRPAAGPERVFE